MQTYLYLHKENTGIPQFQYQPYTGTYAVYVLESAHSDRQSFLMQLTDIAAGKRAPYVWSHNLYKNNIFSIERRYGSDYSSMRSGRIGFPRRSNYIWKIR